MELVAITRISLASRYHHWKWWPLRVEPIGSRAAGRPQSSSGRKMWAAVQALQIGVAVSRSPRGIGIRRSG